MRCARISRLNYRGEGYGLAAAAAAAVEERERESMLRMEHEEEGRRQSWRQRNGERERGGKSGRKIGGDK